MKERKRDGETERWRDGEKERRRERGMERRESDRRQWKPRQAGRLHDLLPNYR